MTIIISRVKKELLQATHPDHRIRPPTDATVGPNHDIRYFANTMGCYLFVKLYVHI